MQTQYTDDDTERAREAERSSAGVDTQRLGEPTAIAGGYTTAAQPARRFGRSNNLAALALIAVGIVMLLGRFLPDPGELTGGMVLLTIASCFLFFSFWQRIYGLLIPGSILAGLSLGVTFASVTDGVSVLWGLSLGFLGILLVGRAFFNVHNNWPIFPAIPLFAVGVIVAISSLPGFMVGGLVWLPLLLIAAGLFLGWRRTS